MRRSSTRTFPQFRDLLVAVIDAREPEEAETTAAALADALAADHVHFNSVRRPDASPFLRKEGLLFLDTKALTDLMDRTIDAQPFLGQLVADPTARGLFSALSLLGMGASKGDVDLSPYLGSLVAFHQSMADVLSRASAPAVMAIAAGRRAERPCRQIQVRTGAAEAGLRRAAARRRSDRRDARRSSPGWSSSSRAWRACASPARWLWRTRSSPPSSRARWSGLVGSVVLITLWLFLAVKTWRLIVPILATLGLGLMLTLLFAAVAVGTLNLVSVGFGILFVGIAVDFAIQFSVRYRERRFEYPDPAEAMRQNARAHRRPDPGRVGGDIGRLPRFRADRFFRRGRTRPDRRHRHADRLPLHDGLPAGGDHAVPPAG